ncbi:hypothetical protein P886_0818 [Alteromonadaceae bacterium 2753L.S.0a.02]|nr:hypothetical protein P886_0818 [Alteromonadaceae bacterium 2753L.S.0a.02]
MLIKTFTSYVARTKNLFFTLAAAAIVSIPAMAHEPNAVSWKPLVAETVGTYKPGVNASGDHLLQVELFPNHPEEHEPLLVVFPGCGEDAPVVDRPLRNLDEILKDPKAKPLYLENENTEPRWRVCPSEEYVLLEKHAELKLAVDFIREENEGMAVQLLGKVFEVPYALLKETRDPKELAALLQQEQHAADLLIEHYYRLNTRQQLWRLGEWEEIFGSASKGPKVTSDYAKVIDQLPVHLSAFTTPRQLPGDIKELPDFGLVLEEVYMAGSGLGKDGEPREIKSVLETNSDAATAVMLKSSGLNTSPMNYSGQTFTLTGKFSTRWSSDHALHPGFGFWVEAWTNETGSWKKLAADWVQWNGTWSLTVPSSKNYQGSHLRVLYRSYNAYYRPQNQNGDSYSWRDPDRYNIATNYDSGHRYADTDGGDYNGVGELVDAAMVMWSRLYWSASINPVRSSPIEFNFPNTWYDCGDGSGVPWSCANFAGDRIWLTAAHGTQASVVSHEMAHALHSKFWNGKMAANTGGSHSFSGCYPSRLGMTLTEGFANFIAGWVGYPARNTAPGGFNAGRWALSFDPEQSTGSPNCSNGWENEVWVARTFWDLHDTRADGDDILWFNHMGGVINLFLGNGVASDGDARDMRDYENIYRNAASSGHEGFVSDIFNQNRM